MTTLRNTRAVRPYPSVIIGPIGKIHRYGVPEVVTT
jgi:hypothetical protein